MPFEAPGLIDFYQGLQQKDRDIAKHNSAMESARLQQEAQSLENMFTQQNNPIRIQQAQTNLDFDKQLNPMKLDAERAKFASAAKQEELDEMFRQGQKMLFEGARANNKEMIDMGQRIVMAHKDFLKLREQGQQKVELQGVKAEDAQELARLRAQLRPPKATGGGNGGNIMKPLGMDKLISSYTQKALDAEAAGDLTTAEQMWARAQAATSVAAARRPDTQAGAMRLGTGGLEPTPPRTTPQLPSTSSAPKKTQQHSLAQVMQMYPGVPAAKVKEAYKRKFGVDLQ